MNPAKLFRPERHREYNPHLIACKTQGDNLLRGDITQLLNKWLAGDDEAREELFRAVHNNLRKMAARYMARENPGHTLRSGALVNDAYIRVEASRPKTWQNRAHFYAVFALTMRWTLVDHARAKRTVRRGGAYKRVPLEDAASLPDKYVTLLGLDAVLNELSRDNPLASGVFHLKHFIGLTSAEIADVLHISVARVNRSWKYAQLWLQRALKSKDESKSR